MTERLQKFLASAGVDSRRKCEELILSGSVEVNHEIVTELGVKVDPQNDLIKVNGKIIKEADPNKLIYILLNKPVGYLTTRSDPQKRKTILDLLKDIKTRIHPIGRLDYNSEGLLLLTNDGELTYHLTHPSIGIEKTYIAEFKGNPEEEKLDILRKGVTLRENYKIMPCKINRLKMRNGNAILKIKIKEGKKRQIRKMGEFIRHRVVKLKRIQMGPIKLGNLKLGKYRYLNLKEIQKLKIICQT
jgi:23S rRNA pseudouridine2605 synthase/16S rRNA pseudouridine516 synthase